MPSFRMGRVNCCTVRLYIRPSVQCIEFSRNMKVVKTYNVVETWRSRTVTTYSKGQGHWERRYKNQFPRILCQKWIDLRQSKTKIITSQLYIYHSIHFTSGNALFCDICLSVCLYVCHIPDISFVHSILYIVSLSVPPLFSMQKSRRKKWKHNAVQLQLGVRILGLRIKHQLNCKRWCENRFCSYFRQKWIDLHNCSSHYANRF